MIKVNLQKFADDKETDPLAGYLDFIGDETVETEEETETEIETEEETEETEVSEVETEEDIEVEGKKSAKKEVEKKPLSKAEHAVVKAKQENKELKALNATILQRLEALEKKDSEKGLEEKRKEIVKAYIAKGLDEDEANDRANSKIENEVLKNQIAELGNLIKSQSEASKNTYEDKMKTEQEMLYKLGKGQKAKVETASVKAPSTTDARLSQRDKRAYEMFNEGRKRRRLPPSSVKEYNEL